MGLRWEGSWLLSIWIPRESKKKKYTAQTDFPKCFEVHSDVLVLVSEMAQAGPFPRFQPVAHGEAQEPGCCAL